MWRVYVMCVCGVCVGVYVVCVLVCMWRVYVMCVCGVRVCVGVYVVCVCWCVCGVCM